MTDKGEIAHVSMREQGMRTDELVPHDKVEGLAGRGREGGKQVEVAVDGAV